MERDTAKRRERAPSHERRKRFNRPARRCLFFLFSHLYFIWLPAKVSRLPDSNLQDYPYFIGKKSNHTSCRFLGKKRRSPILHRV